jgi:hypothetical protein
LCSVCAAPRCVIKFIKGQRYPFSCLERTNHEFSYSKRSIMHHFSSS